MNFKNLLEKSVILKSREILYGKVVEIAEQREHEKDATFKVGVILLESLDHNWVGKFPVGCKSSGSVVDTSIFSNFLFNFFQIFQ